MSSTQNNVASALTVLDTMFKGGLHTRHVVFGAALPLLMVALAVLNGFSTADEGKLAVANAGILSTVVGTALVGLQDIYKGWQQFNFAKSVGSNGSDNGASVDTSNTPSSTAPAPTKTTVTVTHPTVDVSQS